MPASKSSKPEKKAQGPAADSSAPEVSDPSVSDVSASEDAADETALEPTPMNRAERRAKGKVHGQVQVGGRGKAARSTGPAPGPRMWANRRSG